MKLIFKYDEEKDIYCLLKYGPSSKNSNVNTKLYTQLLNDYGENPTLSETLKFIQSYIRENNIDIDEYVLKYTNEWQMISQQYKERAEKIFNISIPPELTVFLSVNSRCPYNISENYFFVNVPSVSTNKTIMHELWHFYTWYKFGITEESKLGKQKYNDLKEALTVLLNVECLDLLDSGEDTGYPQHKELRQKILSIWDEERDIEKLWIKISA